VFAVTDNLFGGAHVTLALCDAAFATKEVLDATDRRCRRSKGVFFDDHYLYRWQDGFECCWGCAWGAVNRAGWHPKDFGLAVGHLCFAKGDGVFACD
jgi:hypothetical protein